MYVYTAYTGTLSVQAQYSRWCPIISKSCYNSSLVTWKVICLTTAKFKPLIIWSSKSKLCYDWRSASLSVLVSSTRLGLMIRFLLLSDSCGFIDVECCLWWEDGSAVYNCCWSLPPQSFLGVSTAGLQLATASYMGSAQTIHRKPSSIGA
jgi:hypothetical protein